MKITRTELRQIIREELNKELQQEGVLDTVKGFFGYDDKEEPTEKLKTFSIKDIKNKIGPRSRPKKEEVLFVFTSMLDGDEEAKELFSQYPNLFKDLAGLKLRDTELSGLNFDGFRFSGSEFSNVGVNNCTFKNCYFDKSNFLNCSLNNINFKDCIINIEIKGCSGEKLVFKGGSGRGPRFLNSTFSNCEIDSSDLGVRVSEKSTLKLSNFRNIKKQGVKDSGIYFDGSNIIQCNFIKCEVLATFNYSNLASTTFNQCVFNTESQFSFLNYKNTVFQGCEFKESQFRGFAGDQGKVDNFYKEVKFDACEMDGRTILPDKENPEETFIPPSGKFDNTTSRLTDKELEAVR